MTLLIDGYNLLNSVGIVGRGAGTSSLERSRVALLNFLAQSLEEAEVRQATVVFDAAGAPPGLPRRFEHRGLAVRFAVGYDDADTLIEELIQADTAPRRLTVVSSDHRVQRAARRRRARAVDSDAWYAEVVGRRREQQARPPAAAKPPVPLLEEEIERWLAEFGGEGLVDKLAREQAAEESASRSEPPVDQAAGPEAADDKPLFDEIDDPFPPGYADDLLEDDPADDDRPSPFPPGHGEGTEDG